MAEITLTRYADVFEALCNPDLRQSLYDKGKVIMADVLLTLHGDAHKQRRHLELRLFRRDYALSYEREVFPATLQQSLKPYLAAGELDLVEFGYRVTMNLTADFAGIDRRGDPEETDRLLAIVKKFSEGATLVHSVRDAAEVEQEVEEAKALFAETFLAPSRARREQLLQQFADGSIDETSLPRDVLTVLLRNQDRIDLPEDVLLREICFYLQAGSHSTANSLVHAIHEIFENGVPLDELPSDPLRLQRCIHESMRLHPASPVAWRTPVKQTHVKGQPASEGDLVILDLAAANKDTSIFGEDAAVFNPERVIHDRKVSRFGLTFGTGVHMCTGRDLDGGICSTADTDPAQHQYGIVSRLAQTLIEAGLSPHPTLAPTADSSTSRSNWGYYPVVLNNTQHLIQ